MPINPVYHTWIQRILELRPGQRITQVRNFVLLMIGIYKSRPVHLSKVAGKDTWASQGLEYHKTFEPFFGQLSHQRSRLV